MPLKWLALLTVIYAMGSAFALSQLRVRMEFSDRSDVMAGSRSLSSLVQEVEKPKKSVGVAILYSLLLPGLGDVYADNLETGKYFLIA